MRGRGKGKRGGEKSMREANRGGGKTGTLAERCYKLYRAIECSISQSCEVVEVESRLRDEAM